MPDASPLAPDNAHLDLDAIRVRTKLWDPAEHIASADDVAAYLEAALEEGDPDLFRAVLGDIARSAGMTDMARRTGLSRQSLYKALSDAGNPEFTTVLKVVRALGLRFTITVAEVGDGQRLREG